MTALRRSSVTFVVLAAGVAACAPARAGDFCEARKTNMNQLVWTQEFDDAVEAFFGRERADFYWDDGRISDQAITGLGGPPNELERLPGGLMMGSACRAHSCPERAAVIVQCPSTIVGVGLKHFRCSNDRGDGLCDPVATFTIFTAPDAPAAARERLEAWARSESEEPSGAVTIEHRTPRGRGAARPRR